MFSVCEQLKRGVSLVIDLSSLYVTKAVRCVTDMLGVAHVSAVDPSFEDAYSRSNTSVNVRPPASVLLQAIRDSVAQENLTNVGIIYDRTFSEPTLPCSFQLTYMGYSLKPGTKFMVSTLRC